MGISLMYKDNENDVKYHPTIPTYPLKVATDELVQNSIDDRRVSIPFKLEEIARLKILYTQPAVFRRGYDTAAVGAAVRRPPAVAGRRIAGIRRSGRAATDDPARRGNAG